MSDGKSTSGSLYTQSSNKISGTEKLLLDQGYQVIKLLGRGSYATVNLASSSRHNVSQVAIKIIHKDHSPKDYVTKFVPREIEVVKNLKHANIIKFYLAIETTLRVYIVMELAENGNLLQLIRKEKFIDETRARKWFVQITEAIGYCHNHGVVHRDIKCENVLVSKAYDMKLSDFGFAKGNMFVVDGVGPLSSTYCGSYAYASPEILKGRPYQPHRSDIWSLGVVLYAMTFGILPFDDSNIGKLLKQVQKNVAFPKMPKTSFELKSLIRNILAPLDTRLSIVGILAHPWNANTSHQVIRVSKQEPETPKKDEMAFSMNI